MKYKVRAQMLLTALFYMCGQLAAAQAASASDGGFRTPAPAIVVYSIDQSGAGTVNLAAVKQGGPVVAALLAMLAYQMGSDCNQHDESGLRCALPTALGFGTQCSEKHISAVANAFPGGVPRWSELRTNTPQPISKENCYAMPDMSNRQWVWTGIALSTKPHEIYFRAKYIVNIDWMPETRIITGRLSTENGYLRFIEFSDKGE